MGTAYYPGGLLALTVHPDGTATGGIVGPANFMWLRAQRIPRYTIGQIMRDDDPVVVSTTDLHPWYVAEDVNAATAIGLRVPGCQSLYHPHSPDTGIFYLVDQHHRCWATLHLTPEPPYTIRQHGHRKLWDEVEAAYRWWVDTGEPAVNAWKFTITPSGHRITLS